MRRAVGGQGETHWKWQKGDGNSLFIVYFLGEVKRAVFVSKTDWASEEYGHRLVGWGTDRAETCQAKFGEV